MLTGEDPKDIKMLRAVEIMLVPIVSDETGETEFVPCVRFKETSTLSTYGRNRLCRKFGSDNFLVVRVATPHRSLSDKRDKVDEDLHARMRAELQGLGTLNVAGKTFRFLTTTAAGVHQQKYIFTSVSLAEIAAWAMPPDVFTEMSSQPVKLALRVALFNSASIATVETSNVAMEADLLAEGATAEQAEKDPALIMTDGCGRIKHSLACKVMAAWNAQMDAGAPRVKISKEAVYEAEDPSGHQLRKLTPFRPMEELPTAFQIRYSGFKGMLVVTNDKEMGDHDIIFAKSMCKFETPRHPEHRTLEVIDFSWPLTNIPFNTEILDVLWGNCVDKENCESQGNFERMMKNRRYPWWEKMETFNGSDRRDALKDYLVDLLWEFLHKQSHLEQLDKAIVATFERNDFLSVKMLLAGLDCWTAFLTGFYRSTLRPLHFPIPDSYRLYGVPERMGGDRSKSVLAPDQVFLQVKGKVVTGNVLILKEPCFVPSDVQRFSAVDNEELCRRYKNVLVFSTQGRVSPASTLAGSDLDGDKFVVIANKKLVHLITPTPVPLPLHQIQLLGNDPTHVLLVLQQGGSSSSPSSSSPSSPSSSSTSNAEKSEQAAHSVQNLCLSTNMARARTQHAQFYSPPQQVETADRKRSAAEEIFSNIWRACLIAVHGPNICTFSELLGIRARVVDNCGADWTQDNGAKLIGALLSQAVDAPKSGKWVALDAISAISTLPKFPHYHPRASSEQVQHNSNSLRSELYNQILRWVENTFDMPGASIQFRRAPPQGTLHDFELQHQVLLRHYFGHDVNWRSGLPLDASRENDFAAAVQKVKFWTNVEESTNRRNIALNSRYWKWVLSSSERKACKLPDRMLWPDVKDVKCKLREARPQSDQEIRELIKTLLKEFAAQHQTATNISRKRKEQDRDVGTAGNNHQVPPPSSGLQQTHDDLTGVGGVMYTRQTECREVQSEAEEAELETRGVAMREEVRVSLACSQPALVATRFSHLPFFVVTPAGSRQEIGWRSVSAAGVKREHY